MTLKYVNTIYPVDMEGDPIVRLPGGLGVPSFCYLDNLWGSGAPKRDVIMVVSGLQLLVWVIGEATAKWLTPQDKIDLGLLYVDYIFGIPGGRFPGFLDSWGHAGELWVQFGKWRGENPALPERPLYTKGYLTDHSPDEPAFYRCAGGWPLCGVNYDRNLLKFYDGFDVIQQMSLPQQLIHICAGDGADLWVVTRDNLILKINRETYRYEMISTLPPVAGDLEAYTCLAWHPGLHQLMAFRVAASGAWRIEFYRPIYQAAILTEPVPVSRLRAGENVRFVSHLVGEAGEGVGSYLIAGSLAAPALGQVLTPMAGAELNGKATLRYRTETPGQDTLQLSLDWQEAG